MPALDHSLLTARLMLVPVTPALAAAARAGGAAFAARLGARAPAEWCESSLAQMARPPVQQPVRAVAVHRVEGCVVGDVRFEPLALAPGRVEIGYSVAPGWRRRGLAVEAAGSVIDWLFEAGGARELIAGCDRRNRGSVRTLRRLGFWLDGSAGTAFWWSLDARQRAEARDKDGAI